MNALRLISCCRSGKRSSLRFVGSVAVTKPPPATGTPTRVGSLGSGGGSVNPTSAIVMSLGMILVVNASSGAENSPADIRPTRAKDEILKQLNRDIWVGKYYGILQYIIGL